MFAITAGMKKYKLVIKKKEKKLNKIVFLAKTKLNSIEFLISKDLTDSSISYDEFPLLNNVVKEYDSMKKEIKKIERQLIEDFYFISETILSYCLKSKNRLNVKTQGLKRQNLSEIMKLMEYYVS